MSRDLSECQTFTESEEEMAEPETEDFLNEVVQNSVKTKKKGYNEEKQGAAQPAPAAPKAAPPAQPAAPQKKARRSQSII
jgi:hypothetical protein